MLTDFDLRASTDWQAFVDNRQQRESDNRGRVAVLGRYLGDGNTRSVSIIRENAVGDLVRAMRGGSYFNIKHAGAWLLWVDDAIADAQKGGVLSASVSDAERAWNEESIAAQ